MITSTEILVRLLLGTLLGGIIGFERHTHGRPAGLRTHILVCVASVLVMILSENYHALLPANPSFVRVDPIRLAAGAITGVGFLGAGVILKTGVTVQGLTTAASIWIVAVMGLAVGAGFYLASVLTLGITVASLWTLRAVEAWAPKMSYKVVTVVEQGEGEEESVAGVLSRYVAAIESIDYERNVSLSESTYHFTVAFRGRAPLNRILVEVSALPTVKKVLIHT